MQTRHLLIVLLALLAAHAATGQTTYKIRGDTSSYFPTDGTIFRLDTLSGTAVIDETTPGLPLLTQLDLEIDWSDVVGGTATCCLGTTV
jgi:hypothetical protein